MFSAKIEMISSLDPSFPFTEQELREAQDKARRLTADNQAKMQAQAKAKGDAARLAKEQAERIKKYSVRSFCGLSKPAGTLSPSIEVIL